MPKLDPSVPSVPRVYDYILGGRNNFAADRELADRLIALVPQIPGLAREARQFLARAVTWVANQEISQFVDLGSGLPTTPNTHETARAVVADARVVYVDKDPMVVSHLNALANGDPGISVVDGDRQLLRRSGIGPARPARRVAVASHRGPVGPPRRDSRTIVGVAIKR